MIHIHQRDMKLTAELVRERIATNPLLEPLAAAGRPATLGYSDTHVWIESGGTILARFLWRNWWIRSQVLEIAHWPRILRQVASPEWQVASRTQPPSPLPCTRSTEPPA